MQTDDAQQYPGRIVTPKMCVVWKVGTSTRSLPRCLCLANEESGEFTRTRDISFMTLDWSQAQYPIPKAEVHNRDNGGSFRLQLQASFSLYGKHRDEIEIN